MSAQAAVQTQTTARPTITPVTGSVLQRQCACGQHANCGECAECKKKREGTLQRAAIDSSPVHDVPPIVHEVLRSPGRPLNSNLRAFMEPRFRRDFSWIPAHSHAGGALQTKLAINKPGDEYEQEADRIANQVMAAPGPMPVGNTSSHIQRYMGQPTAQADTAPASVDRVLASSGRPLEPALRQDMEQRFGDDFSQVRVHSDAAAEQSALDVNAHAYTVEHDMVFGPGQFAPRMQEGRWLIAHELTHVVQQSGAERIRDGRSDDNRDLSPIPPVVQKRGGTNISGGVGRLIARQQIDNSREQGATSCNVRYTKAGNFTALIFLVREAEKKLVTAGHSSVEDRINILRGIYYGSNWSVDYSVEKSLVRNAAFNVYTSSTTPDDPRSILDCGLYTALFNSAEISEGSRKVDFGHVIIGLDARNRFASREVSIPSQGGTGLEITTWLGDLGGGAGMLAIRRVTKPQTRAISVFRGSSFGGSVNLEGDIAAFLIARNPQEKDDPSGVQISESGYIADALQNYLKPSKPNQEWNNRCKNFLMLLGGRIDDGTLANREQLIQQLAEQIWNFGEWYMVNRLRQTDRMSRSTLLTATKHLKGSSKEVASIFVDLLIFGVKHPNNAVKVQGNGPDPSAPEEESSFWKSIFDAKDWVEERL